MKKLLLALTFFLSQLSFAGHNFGGQIYWDALGNDVYSVQFDLLALGSGSFSPSPTINISIGGVTTTLQLQSTTDVIGLGCFGSPFYKVWHYEVVDTIPAPVQGPLEFSYSSAARLTSNNLVGNSSFKYRSLMYPEGANQSSARFDAEKLLYVIPPSGQFIAHNPSPLAVELALVAPLDGSGSPAVYSGNFTAQNPTSATDVLTPGGRFISGIQAAGTYVVAVEATSKDILGRPTSKVLVETLLGHTAPGASNDPPYVDLIPTHSYTTTSDSTKLKITANLGDSLHIRFISFDDDFLPNFSPQSITTKLSGPPGNWTFTPLAPQTGFTSTLTNNTEFEWVIPSNQPPGKYTFAFTAVDNSCLPGVDFKIIEIDIPNTTLIADTLGMCAGNSLTLTAPVVGSSYEWLPATGLSSSTASSPTASPSSMTTYLCKVDGVDRGYYTVLVGTSIQPIENKPSGSQVEILNPEVFDDHVFYHYFVPFAMGDTVRNVSSSGFYHVGGINSGCLTISDSLIVYPDSTLGVFFLDDPVGLDDFVSFGSSDNYQLTLHLGQPQAAYLVDEILLPGATLGSNSGGVNITINGDDNTPQTVYGTSVGSEGILFKLSTPVTIGDPTSNVQLAIDSGTVEVPFKPTSFPYVRNYFTLTQAQGSATNDLIPFVFRGKVTVGLDEDQLGNLIVYPQPAQDRIYVRGLEAKVQYTLLDLNGRLLQSGKLNNNEHLNVSEYSSGMYLLQLARGEEVQTVKVVVRR